MWETRVQSLGREDDLEKEMATRSSALSPSHGWRNLVGYSPWGRKETRLSDFTFYALWKDHRSWVPYHWFFLSVSELSPLYSEIDINSHSLDMDNYSLWLSVHETRQESWSGLLFPSPGDLPNPGIKPWCPAVQADPFPTKLWGASWCSCEYSVLPAVRLPLLESWLCFVQGVWSWVNYKSYISSFVKWR